MQNGDEAPSSKAGVSFAAEANAAAAAEHLSEADGFLEQVVDRLQLLSNAMGMRYDMDTTVGEKAGMVSISVPLRQEHVLCRPHAEEKIRHLRATAQPCG